MHSAPARGDQKVVHPVSVDVSHGDRVEAEGIAGGLAGEGLHQVAVPARIQRRPSCPQRGPAVLPGAYDQIGMAVAVDIAGHRGTGSEAFARGLSGESQESLSIAPRMHVHPTGGRPLRVVVPVRGVDIGQPVAIEVARDGEEHAAQGSAGFVGLDDEAGVGGESPIDVGLAALMRSRLGRAHEEKGVRLVRPAGDRAPERVSGVFPGQGQQGLSGLAGIDVGPARPRATRAVSRSAHDDIGKAVVIHVAHSGGVLAKEVRLVLGLKGQKHAAIAAGIDPGISAVGRSRDHVGNPVAVRISCRLDPGAELIAGLAVHRPQEPARFRRIDIDPAGVLSTRGAGRRRGDDVRHAISIDVADVPGDPSELIVRGLPVPLPQDHRRLHERIGEVLRGGGQGGEARIRAERLQFRGPLHEGHIDLVGVPGLAQPLDRMVGVAFGRVGDPDVVVRHWHLWLDHQGLPPRFDGVIELFSLLLHRAQVSPGSPVFRLVPDHLLQDPHRALGVVGPHPGHPVRESRWRRGRGSLGGRPTPRSDGKTHEQERDAARRNHFIHQGVLAAGAGARYQNLAPGGSCHDRRRAPRIKTAGTPVKGGSRARGQTPDPRPTWNLSGPGVGCDTALRQRDGLSPKARRNVWEKCECPEKPRS